VRSQSGKKRSLTTTGRLRGRRSCFRSVIGRDRLWIAISSRMLKLFASVLRISPCLLNMHIHQHGWSCHDEGLSTRGLSRSLKPRRLLVLPPAVCPPLVCPICGFPSLKGLPSPPLSGPAAFGPHSLRQFQLVASFRACRFWSAQLTAISARKPPFAASHAAFQLISFPSWPPSGRGLFSARSLSTRGFPRLWPLLRPPYSLFQHMLSSRNLNAFCARKKIASQSIEPKKK